MPQFVLRPATPAELGDRVAAAMAGERPLGVSGPSDPPVNWTVDQVPDGVALVVATSGSSGVPKAVMLSAAALRASAEATTARLGITHWVCALPVHHIAGLMTLVRAQVNGTQLVTVSPRLTDLTTPTEPTAISLVPTQLVRALTQPRLVEALASHAAVLIGGAASDPGVIAAARAAGIPVVTTYGMTETCGGCVYDGTPLAGVEIGLAADQRITLAGSMVFSGYLGDSELTARVLVAGGVRTDDRGRWRDGHLEVLGRLDEVVISGGRNVDLAVVQRAVSALRADAVVVGVPDQEWGVVVTVVSESGVAAPESDVAWWRSQLAGTLDSAALPRRASVVTELPRTSSGKVDRQALIATLRHPRQSPIGDDGAPSTPQLVTPHPKESDGNPG